MTDTSSSSRRHKALPDSFKPNHVGTRFIIDCSKIKVEKPKKIRKANALYSYYKRAHSAKYLVGKCHMYLTNHFLTFGFS